MGNQSTGTGSVVSIAFASPNAREKHTNSFMIPQWLKLVRLNGETRIHRLKFKDQEHGHVKYRNAVC